jgi:hypothetical protein
VAVGICPYSDCGKAVAALDGSCDECQRFLKSCPRCSALNRAFANFCRLCRTSIPHGDGQWLGYMGGPQRSAYNGLRPRDAEADNTQRPVVSLAMDLDDACHSLLAYDRHLVAFGANGTVEIADPVTSTRHTFTVDTPLTCQPCIDRGVAYVGSPNGIAAYSLGTVALAAASSPILWQIPLNGTPIHALTIMDNRLYVTVALRSGERELHVIDNCGPTTTRPSIRVLYANSALGWMAADPRRRQLVCFSQDRTGVKLHVATTGASPELSTYALDVPALHNQPIALLGGKAFGVFGDDRKLLVIDVARASSLQSLGSDTQLFALGRDSDDAWTGESVRVERQQETTIAFKPRNTSDSLASGDRVAGGALVLVRGRTAAVGMEDGQVRLYDLDHLPRSYRWRPGRWRAGLSNDRITTLVSFQNYLAAGDARGAVRVIKLLPGLSLPN